MTVREALSALRDRLAEAGVPTPQADAALLVRHVLGWSSARLVTDRTAELGDEAAARLAVVADRRAAREPLQLIVGSVGFRHLDLAVRPGVFIPRPETEVLAGLAIERAPEGAVVVEPCTGTGAVACAVAQESAASVVVATDACEAAVALARANAAAAGVAVEVLLGDLLAPVDERWRGRVDVLVSNPPYVAEAEMHGMEPEVARWDPRDALVSGPTGHEISDRLIGLARRWLRPGGWLLLEVAQARARETAQRCAAAGLPASVVRDLAGRDRFVVAQTSG